MTMRQGFILCIAAWVMTGTSVLADPALGLWRTEADRKNLISHIEITRCGAALCGHVRAAFDRSGNPVKTANIGKRLFWDLKPQGGGTYAEGTVVVPFLNIQAKAKAQLSGNRLRVTGCTATMCGGQTWTRVN